MVEYSLLKFNDYLSDKLGEVGKQRMKITSFFPILRPVVVVVAVKTAQTVASFEIVITIQASI